MSEVVSTEDQLQQFGYGTCPNCGSDNGYVKHETWASECFQCGDCGKWWKLSYVEVRIYSDLALGDTHDEVNEKWQRLREGG